MTSIQTGVTEAEIKLETGNGKGNRRTKTQADEGEHRDIWQINNSVAGWIDE